MQKQNEFINIVKSNEGIIYKITMIYSDNKEHQKDLYQEIVYQLWKSFDSFRGDAKVSTWLYRIALNTSITYLKKENCDLFLEPDGLENLGGFDFSKAEYIFKIGYEYGKSMIREITRLIEK